MVLGVRRFDPFVFDAVVIQLLHSDVIGLAELE